MERSKVRIRFRKDGILRLVSHHDLMRCFERLLRRADLPFHSTEGFNPKPRLVFALSLGLGIIGREEVAELELDSPVPVEQLLGRLAAAAPPGLGFLSVREIPRQSKAHVRRVCYRLALPSERFTGLDERIADLLAGEHVWIDRQRPHPRRFDARPYLRSVRRTGCEIEMDLWVTPYGTVRPDEILARLGLSDVLEGGAVLERILIELTDECGPSEEGPPVATPTGAARSGPEGDERTTPERAAADPDGVLTPLPAP